jgi:hypothetical protein
MKKIIVIGLLGLLLSCEKSGEATQLLDGSEASLPEELKGLKVYNVSLGNDNGHIKLAMFDDNIRSISYPSGKSTQSVVILDNSQISQRGVPVKEIIFENDTLIMARK